MSGRLDRVTAAYQAKWKDFYLRCRAAGADPAEAVILAMRATTAEGRALQDAAREQEHARDRRLLGRR